MVLQAVQASSFVGDGHDGTVVTRPCRDLEAEGQSVLSHHERVAAGARGNAGGGWGGGRGRPPPPRPVPWRGGRGAACPRAPRASGGGWPRNLGGCLHADRLDR